MDYVNKKACDGTVLAHIDGGVPNLLLKLPEATPYHLGYMFYFFEKACGVSGYILGINPFNQPGVEAYKHNMFALLNRPGFEELSKQKFDGMIITGAPIETMAYEDVQYWPEITKIFVLFSIFIISFIASIPSIFGMVRSIVTI